jgi:glycosyltransferase involved in cell wall biosynthesis
MRILLLSNLYPPHVLGGAEILAGNVAAELERLGHEVLVLTSWYGLPGAQHDQQVWRTLSSVSSAHFDQRGSVLGQLHKLQQYYQDYHAPTNAKELRRIVEQTKPDVLYIWELNGIGISSLLSLLPDLALPTVFHLNSYWWQYTHSPETEHSHLRLRWLKRALIGNVPPLTYTSLIAISETVKQKYVAVGCDATRIEVIYNGIDARFLTRPIARKDEEASLKTRLLFVGRLREEKGILVILKALALLIHQQRRNELRLDIFGEGDQVYIQTLQAFIQDKHLSSVVTFHGKVTQDKLIGYYDTSDIMLVPSLWQEPFGLVVAEAMARGLPVIASNVGGPSEIITHEVNGLLVAPEDEEAMAQAIIRLLDNIELRQRLTKTARVTVEERFTIRGNAQQVEQHLLRAIRSEHPEKPLHILSSM